MRCVNIFLCLTYSGNRLTGVADGATGTDKPQGFNDGFTGTDYTYDANGNMNKDLNKGISGITYYYPINLPKLVTFRNGNSVQYIYDATGAKLQKIVTQGGTAVTTNYAGGLIYEGTNNLFLNTEEGRIVLKENGTSKSEYQYHMKDHLGNVRLTFTTGAGVVSGMMATMEQENAEFEEMAFDNIETTHQVDELYNITEGGNTSARLNAAEGKVMGHGRVYIACPAYSGCFFQKALPQFAG